MLGINEMRIERIHYSLLVSNYINSIDLGSKTLKKVNRFIIFTLIVNAFFCWCSSSPESNMYIAIPQPFNHYVNLFIIQSFIVVAAASFLISVSGAYKESAIKSLHGIGKQTHIFNIFIISELQKKGIKIDEKDKKDILRVICKEDIPDVYFVERDFEIFLENYLNKHYLNKSQYDIAINLRYNLTKLILLNQCIERTLIYTKEDSSFKYALIVKNNISLIY
ncbi:TPA: hypothetical protein KQE74_001596 [Clostridioides difficile]|nr:hypothetical protein [Clostridioides difficile]